MRNLTATVLVSLVALMGGCDHGDAVRLTVSSDIHQKWSLPAAGGTTSPALAINNLNARIRGLERRVAAQPNNLSLHKMLLGQLIQRSAALGHFDDLDRVAALGDHMVEVAPTKPAAHIGRAKALAARHLFAEAEAALDKAAELGARPGQLEAQRATLLAAVGKDDEALTIMRRRIAVYPNLSSLGFTGHLLGRLGKHDEAEAAFRLGEHSYRDVSPFALANHYFEWGLMRHEADDEAGARQMYRAALARLPQHAHATVHLAELSPDEQAIALLKHLTADIDEPEAMGLLAELFERQHDPRAAKLLARAKARYGALMARHPLAFADHAGWFWLGPGGDGQRALRAAETNLKLRKNDEAYALFIEAAVAVGEHDNACKAADRALAADYVRPSLRQTAAEAYRACGRAQAASAATRADG